MLSRTVTSQLRGLVKERRPMVLYAAGCLAERTRTATTEALLRHAPDRVVGVVDASAGIDSLADLDGWAWAGPVPVAPRPGDLLTSDRDLVVGISLSGRDRLPPRSRDDLMAVAEAGHRVLSGLPDRIDHPNVVNLRHLGDERGVGVELDEPTATRIAVVGTSPRAGMLSTTIGLTRALLATGWAADWVPTSDAGVLLRGFGRCLDTLSAPSATAVLQALIHTVEAEAELVVVEGQGAVNDPATAGLASTMGHVTASHYHVLCHRPAPSSDGDDAGPVEGLRTTLTEAATRYDGLHRAAGCRSTLLAVALDTSDLPELDVRRSLDAARCLGVPAIDSLHDPQAMATALAVLTGRERA
jgi:uncharacterized NAD-dependent epimerase/dehydratase family protein